MPTTAISPPRVRTLARLAARIGLLLLVGFWTWFIVSVMVDEGAATEPIAMLAYLWFTGGLAWCRPRAGALALVVMAGLALWFLRDPNDRWNAATWLIALPACAIAAAAWIGAPRQTVATPP